MALSTTTADRFREVAAGFTAQTADITADGWDAQTPCTEWKARDLVGHIISWAGPALEDAGVEVNLTEDKHSDPAGAWKQFVGVAQAALENPSVADSPVARGPIPGQSLNRNVSGFLIPDIFMHTWDLARSQGRDVELDDDFAEKNLAGFIALGDKLRVGGSFGAPVEAPADATSTVRLMAYIGRDPRFGLD
jgi:trehalose 6-phosphate phosphatase